jgi:hypothetical protein
LIAGCVAIPIPVINETVFSGQTAAEESVRSQVRSGEDLLDVKARLGEPIVNLGPQRVFVYKWTVSKGTLVWLAGGPGAAALGLEPLVASHLLFIAFDQEGKVLKTGTTQFKPFDTVTEQVREWLSSSGLTAQVVGPRVGESTNRGPALFIYRPSSSPCSFPTYDTNTFKPSVAVDGVVVGDLLKGEYLASEINVGAHVITIDPVPYYRFEGQEESFFAQAVRKGGIPIRVHIRVEPDLPTYVETYLCTGMGPIEMHATIRDAPSALQTLRDLKPAW